MEQPINTSAGIEFMRIDRDINGNPRYICSLYELITDNDKEKTNGVYPRSITLTSPEISSITHKPYRKQVKFTANNAYDYMYKLALWRAHHIGGKKYSTKHFNGCIVFQSYNIEDTARKIKELVNA